MQSERAAGVAADRGHRVGGIAAAPHPTVVDEDAETRAAVLGFEVEEVEGADGRAVVPLDDQAELARLVDVEALLLDEACERMARERRRGAAHVPHLGIVLPGVHPFGVLRFEGPQAAERTFDVHRRQSPMMRLRISIATPQALAFSLIFESRNLVSLYTRLSEYLLVADLRGSMM